MSKSNLIDLQERLCPPSGAMASSARGPGNPTTISAGFPSWGSLDEFLRLFLFLKKRCICVIGYYRGKGKTKVVDPLPQCDQIPPVCFPARQQSTYCKLTHERNHGLTISQRAPGVWFELERSAGINATLSHSKNKDEFRSHRLSYYRIFWVGSPLSLLFFWILERPLPSPQAPEHSTLVLL